MNHLPMLTLCGSVVHVFESPGGVNKEGESFDARPRVQLLAHIPLTNGDFRYDLVTMTTDIPKAYEGLKGKWVQVPVGVSATARGVSFYALKGQPPQVLAS